MRGSDKIKTVIKAVLFAVLAGLTVWGLGEWLYPRTGIGYLAVQRMENMTEAPDVMVVGSSTCYHAFSPKYYDAVTGEHSVMLGTPAQTMRESLMLFEESVNRGNAPKTLLLFVGPSGRFRNYHSEHSVQVAENLPRNLSWIGFLADLRYDLDELPDVLFKGYRAREYLEERIGEIFTGIPEEKEGYSLVPEEYHPYLGEGYAPSKIVLSSGSVLLDTTYNFDEDDPDPQVMAYLDRIAELCRENGTRLIFAAPPRQPADILLCNAYKQDSDYSVFHEYVKKLAAGYGAEFWNFNFIRPELITLRPEMFIDSVHCNYLLGFPLTEIIGEMIPKAERGELVLSDYLYDSFDEYREIYKGIQGVRPDSKIRKSDRNGVKGRKIYIARGADTEAEWCAWISDDRDGEYFLYQDWSDAQYLYISDEYREGRFLKIEVRQPDCETVEQTVILEIE